MLKIENLSFSYKKTPVLKNISFMVEKGDFVCCIGPNGAGKSTLLKCILNILKTENKHIFLQGIPIQNVTAKQMAAKMAYIPQHHTLAFSFSALEVALMGRTTHLSSFAVPSKKDEQLALDALEKLSIAHLASRSFQTLSGGEQQLVLIARALVQEAPILVMDEPTASLDFGNQYMVMNVISKLSHSSYLILLSTHTPEHALQYANKVIALQNGSIFFSGTPQESMTDTTLSALYGTPISITNIQTEDGELPVCFPSHFSSQLF